MQSNPTFHDDLCIRNPTSNFTFTHQGLTVMIIQLQTSRKFISSSNTNAAMLDMPHHVLGGVWDAGCGGEVVELGDAEAGVVVQLHHEALHLLVLGRETLYLTLEMETKSHKAFTIMEKTTAQVGAFTMIVKL